MSAFLRTLRTISYKFGLALLAFASGALTARYLTVGNNGVYKMVTSTLVLGSTYLSGYGNFFNYGLNRLKRDRQAVIGELARLYRTVLIILAIASVVLIALVPVWPILRYGLIIAAFLPLTILYGYSSKLVQALNEIDWLNRLNMIQITVFLLLAIGITIIERNRIFGLTASGILYLTIAALFLSWSFASFSSLTVAHRLARVAFRPTANPPVRAELFAYGRKTSLQNLLAQLNYRSDLLLVGLLSGTVATGLYGTAVTASEVLWHISSSISLMVYARVAREERGSATLLTERTFRYTFVILVVTALFLLAFFPTVMHLVFGPRYDRSIPAFRILLIGTVAFGATSLFVQYFTDQLGKVKFPLYMQTASVVANVLACFALIPQFGILGAAAASSIAYITALILCIAYFLRVSGGSFRGLWLFTKEDVELARRLWSHARGLHESGK